MDLKEEIKKRGLKFVWVAKQIDVNPSSLIVYLNNPGIMPLEVEYKLKVFLK